MKKIAGFTIIGLFAALLAVSAWAWTHPTVKAENVPPPPITDARYLVQTQTRIYYTNKYTLSKDGRTLVLHGYYASKLNDWVFYNMDYTLDAKYVQFNTPIVRTK